jgi:hypothetical protein
MTHHEVISNAVENVAFRLAESRNGIITPAELLPFLPVSLGMIIDILNEAAAESEAITAETVGGLRRYVFVSAQPGGATLNDAHCVACDSDSSQLLCEVCSKTLNAALEAEAETNGWPAQAVYEHELAYLAARIGAPVSAEKLASVSRFTLRRMRQKLELMQQVLAVRKERAPESGVLSYVFPTAPYPREAYLQNMKLIRSLPASITEDVEARVVHILTALGILFLLLLGMAFCHFPFPLLLVAFLITSPILAVLIWKRRSKLDSMEVE